MSRIKLPLDFENKYKSEGLKERIVDDGMWALIPSVPYSMGNRKGIKRIGAFPVLQLLLHFY